MNPRTAGTLLLALAVSLLAAPPTAPVSVDYVESGSMEPAIGVDDGIVLVPAGTVETGDVVAFYSETQDGYVTHRVVGRTESGLLTKGDANPASDQAAGMPPVPRSEVVGTVLTVGGRPVVIPGLGVVATGVERHRLALLGVLGVVALVLGRPLTDRPQRTPVSFARLFRTVVVVGLLVATLPTLLAGSAVPVPLADDPADASQDAVVFEDGTGTTSLEVAPDPLLQAGVTADGAEVVDRNRDGDTVELTLARDPAAPDASTATVRVYRYPPVLPTPVLDGLQAVHPLLAALVANGLLLAPVYLFYRVGSHATTPVRTRWRWLRRSGGEV